MMTPAPNAPAPSPPPAAPHAMPAYLAFGASRVDGRDLAGTDAGYRISSDPSQAGQAAAKSRGLLLVVAEGTSGPTAAPLRKLVLDQIVKSFNDIPPDIDRRTVLRTAFENANAAVRAYLLANPNLGQVGVVATAAIVKGDVMHVAHIGASRACLVGPDGAVTTLTRDHTIGQQHLDRGMKAELVAKIADANSLTRWLGIGDGIVPDLQGPVPLSTGHSLVLTTRGVHGAFEDYQVGLDVANHPPADGVRRLIGHASKAMSGQTATALVYGPAVAKRLPVLPMAIGGMAVLALILIVGAAMVFMNSAGDPGTPTAVPAIGVTMAQADATSATTPVAGLLAPQTTSTVILPTATAKPTTVPLPTREPTATQRIRASARATNTKVPEPTSTPNILETTIPESTNSVPIQSPTEQPRSDTRPNPVEPPPQPTSPPPPPPPQPTSPPPPPDANT